MSPSGSGRYRVIVAVSAACAVLALLAVFIGVVDLAPREVLEVLAGRGSASARLVILEVRLPRVITGMLAGAQFAMAGYLLQTITRNPLADPSIMGVSQGATLAVTVFLLVTVYGASAAGNVEVYALPEAWLPVIGCAGGVVAGLLVSLLALRHDLDPLRIPLCGIAVGTLLQALAVGLIAGWGSSRLEILLQWLAGSLYARSWDNVLFLAPFTAAGALAVPLARRLIELLQFDSSVARSFGLSYRASFTPVLALACGLAASAVGVVGPMVFVGLVVPHLARFVTRADQRLQLPATASLGAALVTAADLLGRVSGRAEEIPVGVMTAMLSAPVLIVILRRTR